MIRIRGAIILVAATTLTALGAADEVSRPNKLPDKAKAILDKADHFELLSLEPDHKGQAKDGFHGWKVLGKTVVKNPQVRKQILESLYEGISKSKDGEGARCFDPRHGIRASVDGKTVDLVICFECHWVYVFYDKDEKREDAVVTTGKPQATWDKVLKEAGVALPKPAKE